MPGRSSMYSLMSISPSSGSVTRGFSSRPMNQSYSRLPVTPPGASSRTGSSSVTLKLRTYTNVASAKATPYEAVRSCR